MRRKRRRRGRRQKVKKGMEDGSGKTTRCGFGWIFQDGETNGGTGIDEVARRSGTVEVESQLTVWRRRERGKGESSNQSNLWISSRTRTSPGKRVLGNSVH